MFTYLLFALLLVKGLESSVVREHPLTADGLQIDFNVNIKDTVLRKTQVDVNEQDKMVRLTRSLRQSKTLRVAATPQSKSFSENISCPIGYVKSGTFCFRDEYAYNNQRVSERAFLDVNEQDKTVKVTRSRPQAATPNPIKLPNLENRFAIGVGLCPIGYVKKGTFCFLDDYA